ncbi:COG1361 family protein [Actinoplanes sp. RD1]|uniref:hypothetical protein n=1 Tax=Actinoplanes sp. RD1 TaxID=3064538 RepID=UPI0027415F72|nr:hypothetical protein [Actinoplanes sp. RD1]
MKISRLWLSLLPLAAAVLMVPAGAAHAAPGGFSVALDAITVAPGQKEKIALLLGTLGEREQPIRSHRLTYTVDLTAAADLVDLEFGGFPIMIIAGDDESPCERSGAVLSCAVSGIRPVGGELFSMGWFFVNPTATATPGATGSITVTAKLDGQAAVTSTSPVRVAESVNLAAANTSLATSAPPGELASIQPRVRNAGKNTIEGTVLQLGIARDLVATDASNCWFDVVVSCVFDTPLEPGRTYGLSAPVQLRPPADAAGGSVAETTAQWLTMSEWEDVRSMIRGGASTAGTGAPLTLVPLGASAGLPQVDPKPASEYVELILTVRGKRPNLAAVAGSAEIPPGGRRTFRMGMVNLGPGTLRPDLFTNNANFTALSLPHGVKVAVAPDRCFRTIGEEAGWIWLCWPDGTARGPGGQTWFTFVLTASPTFRGGTARVSIEAYSDPIELPAARGDNTVRVRMR